MKNWLEIANLYDTLINVYHENPDQSYMIDTKKSISLLKENPNPSKDIQEAIARLKARLEWLIYIRQPALGVTLPEKYRLVFEKMLNNNKPEYSSAEEFDKEQEALTWILSDGKVALLGIKAYASEDIPAPDGGKHE